MPPVHRIKGDNSFLLVGTTGLSSIVISEKAHMAKHLSIKTLSHNGSELITSPQKEIGSYLFRQIFIESKRATKRYN